MIFPFILPSTFGTTSPPPGPPGSDSQLPATLPFTLGELGTPLGVIGAAIHKPAAYYYGGHVGIIGAAIQKPAATITGSYVLIRTGTVGAKLRHPRTSILSYTAIDLHSSLFDQCEAIWDVTRQYRRNEDFVRRQQPLVRMWDAEWTLQHLCSVEYKAQWSWISNDSGPGRIEIPADKPVAKWVQDQEGRIARGEGRNVHVTVDYCGARWGGRLDKFSVEQREDGDQVLVCDFLHDYENL